MKNKGSFYVIGFLNQHLTTCIYETLNVASTKAYNIYETHVGFQRIIIKKEYEIFCEIFIMVKY